MLHCFDSKQLHRVSAFHEVYLQIPFLYSFGMHTYFFRFKVINLSIFPRKILVCIINIDCNGHYDFNSLRLFFKKHSLFQKLF